MSLVTAGFEKRNRLRAPSSQRFQRCPALVVVTPERPARHDREFGIVDPDARCVISGAIDANCTIVLRWLDTQSRADNEAISTGEDWRRSTSDALQRGMIRTLAGDPFKSIGG